MEIVTMISLVLFVILEFMVLGIRHIQASSACNFNKLCSCMNQQEINCVGVPFAVLPEVPISDLFQMTVAGANLEVLQNNSLGRTCLSSLRLAHNGLRKVSPRAFRGTEHTLTSLDLGYNELRSIPVKALFWLPYLQWLSFHSNHLEEIRGDEWSQMTGSTSIRNLYLGHNDLSIIGEGAFSRLGNLNFLELDHNLISRIDGRAFPPTLTVLSLAHNALHHVPIEVLASLKNLTWLQLSGNLIRHPPLHWIPPSPQMERLDISHNLLTNLPANLFNRTLVLRDYHLDFNFLRAIHPGAFQKLKVGRLSLSNNRLSTLLPGAFEGIESSLWALDLSYNLLETYPEAVKELSKLRHLYLRGNHLDDLDEFAFYACRDTLEILDLSGNRFNAIPREALRSTRQLAVLSLQDNMIGEISSEDFIGWGGSLITLSLANNKLTTIRGDTFIHTTNLRELKLSYNELAQFDSSVFQPIGKTLKVLELSSTTTRSAASLKALSGLENLKWLQIDHNVIDSASLPGLRKMRHLEHCDLEGNRIKYLPENTFTQEDHEQLAVLILAHNELRVLETRSFVNLPNLINLVLLGNQIREIKPRAIANMNLLQTVILTRNKISNIEPDAFYNLTHLTNVFLQENNLTELSFDAFSNVGNPHKPLYLNASRNAITSVRSPSDNSTLLIRTLDLTYNAISTISEDFLKNVGSNLYHIFLSHNNISWIENKAFAQLPVLQVIHLDHNLISEVDEKTFEGCSTLQIIHLHHNNISEIAEGTFANMTNLRVLDLSYNNFASLPENIFAATKLERINLSHNNIVRPSLYSFFDVAATLRYLDLSSNQISSIPGKEINRLYNLLSFNLSSNRLTGLQDDVFSNLTHLLHLDISNNPLWKVDERSLEPLVSLETLAINNANISHLPRFLLPSIRKLQLSRNLISNISELAFSRAQKLRHLDLSHNLLRDVPRHVWRQVPDLHAVDLSYNPIEVLDGASFVGLRRLRELDIRGLDLKHVDSRTLHGLRYLTTFKTGTYAGVRSFRLHDLLTKSLSLRRVLVEVEEAILSHQLQWTFGTRLRELVITGANLRNVLPDAFLGLHHTHELILRISGTSIKRLPNGLLRYLADTRFLTLDLRGNQLHSLDPGVLYPEVDKSTHHKGTQHIPGGVLLEENPWICQCNLLWLGGWLRRWMRETLRIQMFHFDAALYVHNMARKSECVVPGTNTRIPIIDLRPEDLGCAVTTSASQRATGTCLNGVVVGHLALVVMMVMRNGIPLFAT